MMMMIDDEDDDDDDDSKVDFDDHIEDIEDDFWELGEVQKAAIFV